jgi:uncharacterized protein YgiM (DUF1202 family)
MRGSGINSADGVEYTVTFMVVSSWQPYSDCPLKVTAYTLVADVLFENGK